MVGLSEIPCGDDCNEYIPQVGWLVRVGTEDVDGIS